MSAEVDIVTFDGIFGNDFLSLSSEWHSFISCVDLDWLLWGKHSVYQTAVRTLNTRVPWEFLLLKRRLQRTALKE